MKYFTEDEVHCNVDDWFSCLKLYALIYPVEGKDEDIIETVRSSLMKNDFIQETL